MTQSQRIKIIFEKRQRVISPDGEGEVLELSGNTVKVRLNTGEIRTYNVEHFSDDADAG